MAARVSRIGITEDRRLPRVVEQSGGRQCKTAQASLILSLPTRLYALDPLSGEDQWWCEGLGKLIYSSPLVSEDAVVAMSGHHGPAIAVTPGGQGDVTMTHRVWSHNEKPPQRVGSGVVVDDCVYVLNEQGIAWCIELATGDVLWKHRLSETSSWSSMCYADGRIYVNDSHGTTYVLEPADTECTVLAKKRDQRTHGSVAGLLRRSDLCPHLRESLLY